MFAFQLLCAVSSAAVLVCGSPTLSRKGLCCDGSDASTVVMDLPANQTALVSPTSGPLFVMLGVGIQNYTCSDTTLSYASIGAVASLFDISCLEDEPEFSTVQTTAFYAWETASDKTKATSIGRRVGAPKLLGFHYFVTSPSGTGLSPKWDFTSTGKFAGNSTAYVIGAKVGDIVAPTTPSTNIDWLTLKNAEGGLASQIFRIDTVAGQPPTSCVAGSSPISVKYTAKYYLY